MGRVEQVTEYRKAVLKELQPINEAGEDISMTLLTTILIEISDTLAIMCDKYCDKEE